ncbi:MAG TPA: carboxypeptidase regulatory-like domain-containing protein [Pyrinomonadaceae bacterium]|nr:carboxypeptidase regulatory-like domain-containing protein [Pyrinomonadaceae bacterium]
MSKLSRFAKGSVLAVMAAFLLAALLAPSAFAQKVTSNVNVTVKDESGAVVPGVSLTLTSAATKTERTGVANDEGYFSFNEMSAGEYTLTVEKTGFKKTVVEGIKVDVGGVPAEVNIGLVTGGVEETVMVTASEAQAVINNENASLSTTVQLRQVQDLPINGRNPLNLAGLQAGVNTATNNNRTASINGLRGTFSNLTWDGININDNFVRTDSLFGAAGQSVAGVAEFTITTQNGGSDEGLGVAQVRLSTPRGTTDFHGSLFEFHRNSKFDANTFFNNSTIDARTGKAIAKPKLIQNQFGGNVGGPFRLPRFGEGGPRTYGKDKLFFYAYFEATREASDASRNRTVLVDAARNGTFTYRRADNNQLQTVNLLSLTGRAIDPRILRLIALTPSSNNTEVGDTRNTAGFRFNSPSGSTSNLWGFRTDYDLSSKHRFEAIFSRFKFDFPNDTFNDIGEQFPGLPGGGQGSRRPRGSFAWIWSPTQNLSNEFRTGFFRTTPSFLNTETFPEGNRLTFPISTNPVQNFLQQGRVPTNYDFIDNASLVRGEHVIRFGGVARRVRVDVFNDAGTLPTYTLGFNTVANRNPLSTSQFPGGVSANDFTTASNLLALLTGAVTSAAQTFNVRDRDSGFISGFGERRGIDYNTLSFYGGDTWRMRPNMTINLGLRWEYVSPPTERNGLALLPVNTSLDALRDPNAVLDFAGNGTGRAFHNKDLNNFAPNVSIAWDPFNDGKTSVRAGYAISYVLDNNVTTVQNAAISSNAGLSSAVSLTGLGGTISGGGAVPVPAPTFRVPRTIADNLTISQTPTLFTVDPNLKTPYVQQWNIGFQREIFRDTAFEIRYVGNRGIKLTRAIDTNQTIIRENGFLQDFLRAQQNLALARQARLTNSSIPLSAAFNAAIPGSQQLLIFPRLGNGGALNDATFINLIDTNQVGELASQYVQLRRTYLTPGTNGSQLSPAFFLPANPNAFVTDYIGNGSWSDYHGLQAEVRKRLSSGFFYQVNYTYSKAFTDFDGSQANFQGFLDLATGGVVEKRRTSNDVTHVFKANGVYELPFGPGKRFLNFDGFLGKIFGGFQLSGLYRQQSGRPINILTGLGTTADPYRGTLNRQGRSTVNTVNTTLSISELQARTGLFFNPTTGRPQLFDPSLIGTDGRGNPAFFQNPGAGQIGTLQQTPVSGPGFWNADMALIKRTKITEGTNIELRLEAFNVFNHTNFSVTESQSINSSSFGRISSTFDPRILQFAFKFNF